MHKHPLLPAEWGCPGGSLGQIAQHAVFIDKIKFDLTDPSGICRVGTKPYVLVTALPTNLSTRAKAGENRPFE